MIENILVVLGAIGLGALLIATAPEQPEALEVDDEKVPNDQPKTTSQEVVHSNMIQKMRVH